ncbi:MAG: YdcH family protein [Paracoccaceae bacterium]
MSVETHLAELRKKHELLSEQVEEEQKHPGSNDLMISELKKQKLKIKEEIERLSAAR